MWHVLFYLAIKKGKNSNKYIKTKCVFIRSKPGSNPVGIRNKKLK
jgi:hypothetical protein